MLTLIAKVPSGLRAKAVVIIADTRHSVGAVVATAILRRVPSGASRMCGMGVALSPMSQRR